MPYMVQYIPAAGLRSCFLSDDTPLGLFKPRDSAPLMLVAEVPDGKVAILLDTFGHEPAFASWLLEVGTEAWFGVALGPVELECDWHSITHAEARTGDIEIHGGGALLLVSGVQRWQLFSVPMTTPGNPRVGRSATVKRWRLVQRDHLENPVVLFERGDVPIDGLSA